MAELKVTLDGDASGLTKALDKATASVAKWSNQVDKDTKDATRAFAQIATSVTNSIDRASRALSRGFGKGIISRGLYTDLRLLDNNLQKISLGADQATNSLKGMGSAAPAINNTANASTRLVGAQGNLRRANRQTSAGMIEFTRLIGDAPYGIRGMANNLQQMAFVMGAGGPLLLAITAASAALDYFTNNVNRSKEEAKGFSDVIGDLGASVAGEVTQLRTLVSIAQDHTQSLETRTNAIAELNANYEIFNEELNINNINNAAVTITADKLTESLIRQAKIKGSLAKITEISTKLQAAERKTVEENVKWYDYLWASVTSQGEATRKNFTQEDILDQAQKRRAKTIKGLTDELSKYEAEVRKLTELDVSEGTNEGAIDAARKAAEAARKALESVADKENKALRELFKNPISTKGLEDSVSNVGRITSQGLSDAVKQFDSELKKAAADFAKYFPDELLDFVKNPATSTAQVQPDLSGPKGSIIKPVVEDTKNVWETLAADMETNMSQSIRSFGSELTSVFRELELTGRSAFNNIMDGLRVSLNAALQNTVQSIASSIGSKVGASVGESVGNSVSKTLGNTIGGILGPGLGTLVGGVITGIGSLIGGLFGRRKRRREAEKQAEIQRKQLEEQKRMAKELERQSALAYTSSIIGKMLPGFGSVSNIDINSMGELTARVDGKDLLFVLGRAEGAKKRGV